MATDSILIVGVGGLGVPALWSLARAGARRLTLVDPDPVELSNLARQVIYRSRDIGTPKVEAAARWLGERFPSVNVETHPVALDESNAERLIAEHDFVIDATDSPIAKFLINDTCIAARTPFVYGGVVGMTGQAMTVIPTATACIRCVFEAPPDESEIQSCREAPARASDHNAGTPSPPIPTISIRSLATCSRISRQSRAQRGQC